MPHICPSTVLGRPPKYCEKLSIGVFACIGSDNACFEILRGKTSAKKEDIYIIPFPRAKLKGFHESIHESGEVHWVWEYGKVYKFPLYGKEDITAAFRIYLELKSPICVCFRSGRNLTEDQIELLVSRLIEHIPFDLSLSEISRNLCERGFIRFIEKSIYFQLEERRLWKHQLLKLGLKPSTRYYASWKDLKNLSKREIAKKD